jgi:succinyl-diaminopimelate desuccinylase
MEFGQISEWIEASTDRMVRLQEELTSRPAIGPENGGQGEWEKARFLESYLADHGLSCVEHYDCPDARVPEGTRPNFAVTVEGESGHPRIWVMSHLDVVPPGERAADGSWQGWGSDPYTAVRAGDRLVGRGVLDNHQAIVSSVFAVLAIVQNGLRPRHSVKLLFVSDEETGSDLGLAHVLETHRRMFSPEDMIIVPDGGNEDGTMIEVAEKSALWLEFRVEGRQAHGSRPDRGINAFRAAAHLVSRLDRGLAERFGRTDHLFVPPSSTFEPTIHAANVANVNTIPGQDVFCFDCRVLPSYKLDDVLAHIQAECRRADGEFGTTSRLHVRSRSDAPRATAPEAPVVRALTEALRDVRGVRARAMGMGGLTVASVFRRAGLQAAVWMTSCGTEHQANESVPIANMAEDAKVFARVFLTDA